MASEEEREYLRQEDLISKGQAYDIQNIHADPTDPKHTPEKCSFNVCCAENLRRMWKWLSVSEWRRAHDFTDYWKANGTQIGWDNHRQQYLKALEKTLECSEIIEVQVLMGQCVPIPAELSEFAAWRFRANGLTDPGPFAMEPVTNSGFVERVEVATGLTGGLLVVYLIVSEGSRVAFPPRNLVPAP